MAVHCHTVTRSMVTGSSLCLVTPQWLNTNWLLQQELLANMAVKGGRHTFFLKFTH